ncbi:hypothetical protein G3U99_23190 [Vibrio coralliilyticus OCN008]|uniref:hypothetical protein n=1 Tax=Vibrio coralliilyticus TaxID=190893 RepID=UPI0003912CF8|nr:hypothetical protein [Vibrio coralliilyticus]ERB66334.1 hypothetical protein N779_05560 [Vibrio coralliilyticus OCN008]QIJ87141.1 hypothetical protein G3U99_23190 [Vibrio coralliilyticus OCN008]
MPIELSAFEGVIEHKKSKGEEVAEASDVTVIKLDEADGIGVALGFTNNSLSKADYLHVDGREFIVIEASDLRDQLADCIREINVREQEALIALQQEKPKIKKLPVKLKKPIENSCYYALKAEMMQKWCGSIAISERLCRSNGIKEHPNYSYMIVCKNGTDVQVLDRFKQKMEGTIKNISVVTTDTIPL